DCPLRSKTCACSGTAKRKCETIPKLDVGCLESFETVEPFPSHQAELGRCDAHGLGNLAVSARIFFQRYGSIAIIAKMGFDLLDSQRFHPQICQTKFVLMEGGRSIGFRAPL